MPGSHKLWVPHTHSPEAAGAHGVGARAPGTGGCSHVHTLVSTHVSFARVLCTRVRAHREFGTWEGCAQGVGGSWGGMGLPGGCHSHVVAGRPDRVPWYWALVCQSVLAMW